MKPVPPKARLYLLAAAFLLALPGLLNLYHGHNGKLLVATSFTRGTPFDHAVVYEIDHNGWGAMGIVINKPAPKGVIPMDAPEVKWGLPLYDGGPVEKVSKNFLMIPDDSLPGGVLFAPVEFVRRYRPDLAENLDHGTVVAPLRLFTAYAGWTVMQLNLEIARGGWEVIDADPDIILHTKPEDMWDKAAGIARKNRPGGTGGI